MFGSAGLLAGYVRTGKLRALGVAGRRREPLLPDVPTMQEAGLADFRAVSWDGLFAPKQTPAPILDRTHAAVQAALEVPEIRKLWAEQGRPRRHRKPRRLHALRQRGNPALERDCQSRQHPSRVTGET